MLAGRRFRRSAFLICGTLLAAVATGATRSSGSEYRGGITIAWAQWKPSDLLQRLSKRFTKETGIKVTVNQIPWSQFETRIQQGTWARHSPEFDLIIGDSQWLGRGATQGHYADITKWSQSHVPWSDVVPAARTYYCDYNGRTYGVPCEADAPGFAYRRDLFENPDEMAAFQTRYGYPLAPPQTWAQFRDVAEFFNRPDQGLNGAALFYGGLEQYDEITMGFDQLLWSFGGELRDSKTGAVQGVLNSPTGVSALEFYTRELRQFTPEEDRDAGYDALLTLYKSGKVAMVQSWYTFFPGLVDARTNPLADRTGYFVTPGGPGGHFISLGGQGMSLSAYSRRQAQALRFMGWFSQDGVQRDWGAMGGLTCYTPVLNSAKFRSATPFNAAFADSVPLLKDFYNVPQYSQLLHSTQVHWHASVVGTETPQEAMDAVAAEHQAILNPPKP